MSNAIADSARASGAVIRTNAPVEKILVKNGRAAGVVLAGGEEILAPIVASNLDPRRTFLHLVEEAALPADFVAGIRRFRSEGTSLKMNLALSGLPEFTAFPGAPGPQHRATMHLCPSIEYVERAWDDAKYGRPSRSPLIEMTIPTMYDASLAPPGRHIMGIFLQYAPYTLKGTDWDTEREPYADRVLDVIQEYCPNIRDIVVERQTLTPLDLERRFGLTGGNIFHGEMSLDQMFVMRPLAGWAKYRTPIKGLYLCGSGAHPGGGVMGAPGTQRRARNSEGPLNQMTPLRLMPTRHSPFYTPFLAVHAAGFLREEGIESTLRLPAEGESTAAVLRRGEVDVIQSAVSAAWTAIEKGVDRFPGPHRANQSMRRIRDCWPRGGSRLHLAEARRQNVDRRPRTSAPGFAALGRAPERRRSVASESAEPRLRRSHGSGLPRRSGRLHPPARRHAAANGTRRRGTYRCLRRRRA